MIIKADKQGDSNMNLLRMRMYHLIEQIPDDELYNIWHTVLALYCDSCMMKAIAEVHQLHQPWDMLTHDEAIKQLMFL